MGNNAELARNHQAVVSPINPALLEHAFITKAHRIIN